MNSLKYKLILAMVTTSIVLVGIILIVSPYILKRRFIEISKVEHYNRFIYSIVEFKNSSSSWGTPESARAFFAKERKNKPTDLEHLIRIHAVHGELPIDEKERNKVLTEKKMNQLLPFRFGVIDHKGYTLIEFRDFRAGDRVPKTIIENADLLKYKGDIIGYAIPEAPPKMTPRDIMYFKGLKEAILYGSIGAVIVSLLLGFVWGTQLTRSLTKLTAMAKSMKKRLKGQQVEIKSGDEIGVLAGVFNETSRELAETHEELIFFNNIIKEQALKLRELSIKDELTGLYNRRFFNEQVVILHANAKRYNHPLSIVIGDIDFFKDINDNFSHLTGDKVLKMTAGIITNELRKSDIVARYGGEEIIIALPETEPEKTIRIVERIRKNLEKHPWDEVARGLRVTMSFGICSDYTLPTIEKMTAVADKNLYRAKEGGRNRIIADAIH